FVSHAFTRTHRTFSPQSWFLTASTTFARADSFSRGATESSRSMNTMSAARPGALASIFSLDPGTDRQERRGRFRVRSDIPRCYGSARIPGYLEARETALPVAARMKCAVAKASG